MKFCFICFCESIEVVFRMSFGTSSSEEFLTILISSP